MKTLTAAMATASIAVGLAFSSATQANPWRGLYGDKLIFDVYRNGERVGQYQTEFRDLGDDWLVEARMELDLKWLFWDYRYRYHAIELWQQDRLTGLDIRIDRNGDTQNYNFERQGGWLKADTGEIIELPVLATHHYDVSVVTRDRVVNTLTGKVNQVEILPKGVDTLMAGDQTIRARRYLYTGDLTDTQVWYDLSGRWVGLEFTDQQGANVTFKCQRCGQGTYL